MVSAINIENLCAGLETSAFVAFLMSLCNQALFSYSVCFTLKPSGFQSRYSCGTSRLSGRNHWVALVLPAHVNGSLARLDTSAVFCPLESSARFQSQNLDWMMINKTPTSCKMEKESFTNLQLSSQKSYRFYGYK